MVQLFNLPIYIPQIQPVDKQFFLPLKICLFLT